jgi:hypothetical protein
MTYNPDKWMLIKLTNPNGQVHYRVFGSWSGSYLDGDSWRMNSGIVGVTEDDKYYYFEGSSGSVYACHKEMYGATAYGYSVAQSYAKEVGPGFYLMDQPENIMEMSWN